MNEDYNQRNVDPDIQSAASTRPVATIPKRNGGGSKKLLTFALVLLLVGAAGFGSWWYANMQADKQIKQLDSDIALLEKQKNDLEKSIEDSKKDSNTSSTTSTDKTPTATTLANLEAAVKSGNYAATEQLMAASVNVIIAASEGLGPRTPAQVVADLKYLDTGTDPWNFALSKATLDGYAAGSYKSYFPATALVGKSANDRLVSFVFDNKGKVSGIFMAADANALQ